MGSCLTKSSFTVNKGRQSALKCLQPLLFSKADAEEVLQEADVGDYLMYRDHESDRIILSIRYQSYIYHRRITELNNLYYLESQPYPYLDSIVLYHRKHKLNGLKLIKQAHLSARVVRMFAHKVTNTNGNREPTHLTNKGLPPTNGNSCYPIDSNLMGKGRGHFRNGHVLGDGNDLTPRKDVTAQAGFGDGIVCQNFPRGSNPRQSELTLLYSHRL